MTVLNIFSLNDNEQRNIIASLPEGKHTIGRGELLKVSDKRVSRKHAIINVSDDKVTLTSVHVNPCFFKAVNGTTLTVLHQNQENELNDGDQFALLPEDYWFKVKVERQIEEELYINGKRQHESTLKGSNSGQDAKKARLSGDSNEIERNDSRNDPTTSNVTDNDNNYCIFEKDSSCDQDIQDNNLIFNDSGDFNTSIHFQETARIEDIKQEDLNNDTNEGNNVTNITCLPIIVADTNDNIKEEPEVVEVLDKVIEAEHHVEETNRASNDLENLSTKPNNIQPVVKVEVNDNDSASGSRSGEASAAQPGPPRTRREKCWYGERCFRKNPNHRETFKHPGDQDYDSDPDDDRPDCPYGMGCYRLNPEHRREYRHIARPAPKPRPALPNSPTAQNSPPATPGSPLTTRSSPTTQNSPPKNKRKPKRKATKKADYDDLDDDYDYNDPFLNDGSSDDFEPSDSSLDSTDSDWEDSQELQSQDRKRMLREAKRFTKNKKKN